MAETLTRDYQSTLDMDQVERTVPGRNFYVHLAGKTNDAHQDFVDKLRGFGQNQVSSPEESDYLMVFCPIASRVGPDIRDALNNMPGGKQAILVVMHHTFNRDSVVVPSNRQVDNQNVLLTVDCLFHEHNLLKCNRNDIEWNEVQKLLGGSQVSFWQSPKNYIINWFKKYWKHIGIGCVLLVGAVITGGLIWFFEEKKKKEDP